MLGDTELTSWAVVETRPNAEHIAEKAIIRLGYEPLVIRYHKLLRGVRIMPDGSRVRSRHDELQPRPFIPGYLFLALHHNDDATLIDTDNGRGKPLGVKRVLRRPLDIEDRRRPKLIRASIVEQIKLAALERDETPRQVRTDLKERMDRGEVVRVRHPLGFMATLIELDEKGRGKWFSEQILGGTHGTFDETEELELVEA